MTVKPVYFCYADLKRLDACEERFDFKRVFGTKRVLVTVTTAVAHVNEFNWWWIAESALNGREYVKLRTNFQERFGNNHCWCAECDPHQQMRPFVAQGFVEGFISQGGMEGRKR